MYRSFPLIGLLHVLASDGCFYGHGMFRVAPRFETKQLEEIFRHNVFKMLLSKGKITQELVDMLMSWPPAHRAYASEKKPGPLHLSASGGLSAIPSLLRS